MPPSSPVLYTRPSGKRLTYEIVVDQRGRYTIGLNGAILKRGVDPLVEHGLRAPGPDVMGVAIAHAKVAILYLIGMRETYEPGTDSRRPVEGARRPRY